MMDENAKEKITESFNKAKSAIATLREHAWTVDDTDDGHVVITECDALGLLKAIEEHLDIMMDETQYNFF